jgi:hypothetical protein
MSISSVASRGFSVPFNTTSSSATSQPPAPPPPPQMGAPSGGTGMPPRDMFDTGFRNGNSPGGGGVDSVGGAAPGSRAFGDMLHHAMKSAGVDDETIKTVLAGLNGGRTREQTPDFGPGGANPVGGVAPGSQALGNKLHHVMQSAGVDDETIKTVLSGLNGGRPPSGPQGAGGLGYMGDLMAQLDDNSARRLQSDQDSLNQLINNPHLTAQLAQAPEVFKMLMTQPG